jgi:hypothetical protein
MIRVPINPFGISHFLFSPPQSAGRSDNVVRLNPSSGLIWEEE